MDIWGSNQRRSESEAVNIALPPLSAGVEANCTRAETRFRLSAKLTSPFKSAGGRQFSRLLAAEVCASAVAMLDTPCSEVLWRVLATHSIRQFPLHFPSRASLCAITFQLDSTVVRGLQHGRFGVRLPVGERDVFLLQNVQTGSGVHPASYSMATGVPSAVTAPTSIANTWSYTSITCMPSWYGREKKLHLFYLNTFFWVDLCGATQQRQDLCETKDAKMPSLNLLAPELFF